MDVFGEQNFEQLAEALEDAGMSSENLSSDDDYLKFYITGFASGDAYEDAVQRSYELFEDLFAPGEGELDGALPPEGIGYSTKVSLTTGAWSGENYMFRLEADELEKIRRESRNPAGYDSEVLREGYLENIGATPLLSSTSG